MAALGRGFFSGTYSGLFCGLTFRFLVLLVCGLRLAGELCAELILVLVA